MTILECWDETEGWRAVGEIGFEAGQRFLQRATNQRWWRLRDGKRIWKVSMNTGRIVQL